MRTAIKVYFLASANDGVFLPGYMALIRDNGIANETLIHGYLLIAECRAPRTC